jgi:hypothetical protein
VVYEDDGVGRIFVPVMIDGQGPFPFEVDTGSDFVLTAETAAALHLKGAGTVNTTGGGTGVIQQSTVPTREIRSGNAFMLNHPAWVIAFAPTSNDRGKRPPRAGFVGAETAPADVGGITLAYFLY